MIGYIGSYCDPTGDSEIRLEEGKTYAYHGEKEGYSWGFSFYKTPRQAIVPPLCVESSFRLLKIKAIGHIADTGRVWITDKIEVIEEIPKSQYGKLTGAYIDDNGRLSKVVTLCGHAMYRFEYNEQGDCVRYVNGDSITDYLYDKQGNRIQVSTSDGKIIKYIYDKNNNLVEISNSAGESRHFLIDGNNNRIKSIVGGKEAASSTYNEKNQLIREVIGDWGCTYEYDKNNNIIYERYDSGGASQIIYDDKNRKIKQIDSSDDPSIEDDIITWRYNDNDNLIEEVASGKVRVRYIYDEENRLIRQFRNGYIYDFEYDNDGNRILIREEDEDGNIWERVQNG